MIHSHTKIWIHIVWSVKNRERVFFNEKVKGLFKFLIKKCDELKVPSENINIQPEHIHLLVNLPSNICLSDFVKNIKGSSSHWLNTENILKTKFSWQRGYGAFSVSSSQLEIVKNYIKNQSEHHKKKTFIQEYEKWQKEYGLIDE